MVREEPEVFALLAVGMALAARSGDLRERVSRYAWPAAMAGVQDVAALSLAMMKDGAPTHHPERAVLSAILLAAVMAGALGAHALGAGAGRGWKGMALVGAAMVAAVVVRPYASREGFVQRGDEEAGS